MKSLPNGAGSASYEMHGYGSHRTRLVGADGVLSKKGIGICRAASSAVVGYSPGAGK